MEIAIVIPIYKLNFSKNELISVNRTKSIFKNRDIIFLLPNNFKNNNFDFFSGENVNIIYVDDYYLSNITGYNRLFININFYNKFIDYSHILICQIDVYVFKDELDYWANKNFCNIGAPILDLNYNFIKFKKGNNGGYCLRNIKFCLDILSKDNFYFCNLNALWICENNLLMKIYRIFINGILFNYKFKPLLPILNEDIFWSVIAPYMFPFYKTPSITESTEFAFDTNPKYFYHLNNKKLPSAIHAWSKYDFNFVQSLVDEYK